MAKTIIEEIDDDEYLDAKNAERHKEMYSVMKEVSNALKENKSKPLEDLLSKNNELIGKFISGLSNLKPAITNNLNQDEVVKAISGLSKEMKDELIKLQKTIIDTEKEDKKEPMKEWTFDVVRNNYGYIQKINAKQIK